MNVETMLRRGSEESVRAQLVALAVFLGLTFAVAGIGSVFTSMSVNDWYETIERPTWTPPGALFGPVWSTLYFLIALAGWLVWRKRHQFAVATAMALWGLQLALNLGWSVLFFGLENPGAALVEIVVLWAAIAATIAAFWRVHRVAALLLVPYIAWVTFAAALNFEIWRLN